MRYALSAAALAVALSGGAAKATPLMGIKIFDGSRLIASDLNIVGGLAFLTGADANVSYSVGANGIPVVLSPDLSTITLDASSNAGTVLTVLVTQTNIVNPWPVHLFSTFTFNALTGSSETASFTNYIDVNNTAFAETTPIAHANLSPIVTGVGPFLSEYISSPMFSETEKYVINFRGANQSVSLSSQIVDAPEPTSTAILGAGLIALGFTMKSRKSSARLA